MKLVVQNPHYLSDTRGTRVHDYLIELLIRFRPAVRIWPLQNLVSWFRFLLLKKLPLHGWTYVFNEQGLKSYDVWLNFNGKAMMGTHRDPMPRSFSGMKLLHLMDYSFQPRLDEERIKKLGINFVFGYARHDLHCGFFRKMHPSLSGRVIPVPFGYLPRFRETLPFAKKENRCSLMGAVVPMREPSATEMELSDYFAHFLGKPCAHELRWHLRNEGVDDSLITSFLPRPSENVTWSYDSALELNRHRFFLNDDSIMHYPPARTYEGLACGSIMLAAREPVYEDFAFKDGVNCLLFEPGNIKDMKRMLKEATLDPERCQVIHDQAKVFADRFSHRNVGTNLYRQIEMLWEGRTECARTFWSHANLRKG